MIQREQLLPLVTPYTADTALQFKYADHLAELLMLIDGTRIGTEYCRAIREADYSAAVQHLARYYRNKPQPPLEDLRASGGYSREDADRAVRGCMCVVSRDWTFADGEIDFLFDPTALQGPRNHEWLWQLNRHGWWPNLARTYSAVKDETYALAFRKQLLAWIAQTDIPPHWNGPGSAWRTIECGIRLFGTWPVAFDGFRHSASMEDVVLLLMIASMHRQTVHLLAHPTTQNWLMMEANGIYTFSALFDELTDSGEARRTAADWIIKETEAQILADGMHNELTPDYHSVVVGCACGFLSLARALGYGDEIPASFIAVIRRTVDAAIRLSTPALTQPCTNDTYTIPVSCFTSDAEALIGASPVYRYFNTARREGTPPDETSVLLPYAGFAVMRSGWDADAAYLCFDVGPLGMAHIHQDLLNIILYRGCEELLHDDGGGQYESSTVRRYAVSAYAHNTVLVDGKAQHRSAPKMLETPVDAKWITTPVFDYAEGTYDGGFTVDETQPTCRCAVHTRRVRFCKPGFFCVSDKLVSADGEAHDYTQLFHMDTTDVQAIAAFPGGMLARFAKTYDLLMVPLDGENETELRLLSAQTEPRYAGWYNGRNDRNLHPATTAERTVRGKKDCTMTVLLFPVRAGDPLPLVKKETDGTVSVVFEGQEYRFDPDDLAREL